MLQTQRTQVQRLQAQDLFEEPQILFREAGTCSALWRDYIQWLDNQFCRLNLLSFQPSQQKRWMAIYLFISRLIESPGVTEHFYSLYCPCKVTKKETTVDEWFFTYPVRYQVHLCKFLESCDVLMPDLRCSSFSAAFWQTSRSLPCCRFMPFFCMCIRICEICKWRSLGSSVCRWHFNKPLMHCMVG